MKRKLKQTPQLKVDNIHNSKLGVHRRRKSKTLAKDSRVKPVD